MNYDQCETLDSKYQMAKYNNNAEKWQNTIKLWNTTNKTAVESKRLFNTLMENEIKKLKEMFEEPPESISCWQKNQGRFNKYFQVPFSKRPPGTLDKIFPTVV